MRRFTAAGCSWITMARWSPAELRQLRAPLVPDLREAVDEDDGQRLALADPVQRCSGRRCRPRTRPGNSFGVVQVAGDVAAAHARQLRPVDRAMRHDFRT